LQQPFCGRGRHCARAQQGKMWRRRRRRRRRSKPRPALRSNQLDAHRSGRTDRQAGARAYRNQL